MNLSCLGFALIAAITPPSTPSESCPAESQTLNATTLPDTKAHTRFPSLMVGEKVPETPLQSLRRLIAIRNAEESLDSEPKIELISEDAVELALEEESIEREVELVAVVERMPLEAEIKPDEPVFESGEETTVTEIRSLWFAPGEISQLIGLETEQIALSHVQPTAIRPYEEDAPILPELVQVIPSADSDPFLNGEFECGDPNLKQTATVVISTRIRVEVCEEFVTYFDDDYEEVEDMMEGERIALEAAIRTLR